MKKVSQSHHGTLNELNITPLLDLAFVLLVIFIITTPQLVNNLEMNLPSTQVPPPTDKPPAPPHQIVVAATGEVTLNGQPMSLPGLRSSLTALKQQRQQCDARKHALPPVPSHDLRPAEHRG